MTDSPLVRALDEAGYRLTRPRREVAELIGSQRSSFTAGDLLDEAGRRRMRVGRATVFRALDTLAELGALERLELPDGEHAYVTCEPRLRHHHHVICRRCGRASEITGCDVAGWARDVEDHTGYAVDTHRIELYGVCPTCRAANETESRQSG